MGVPVLSLEASTFVAASALLAAAVIGFTAHRASLCNVRAVAELLDNGTAHVLGSLLSAAAWAALVSGVLAIGLGWQAAGAAVTPEDGLAWAGAFVFGVGAAVNGGCALSTLHRLADGELGMLLALVAFVLGVAGCAQLVGVPQLQPTRPLPGWWQRWPDAAPWLLAAGALWALTRCVQLTRVTVGATSSAPGLHLGLAAALLGLAGGWLYATQPAWSYTGWLRAGVLGALGAPREAAASAPLHAALVLALVAGMGASALLRRQAALRWPTHPRDLARHLVGGVAMGGGAALVPGGNDTLLLSGLPSLTLRAAGAYGAMLLGIACSLWVLRRVMPGMPRLSCSPSGCAEPARPPDAASPHGGPPR